MDKTLFRTLCMLLCFVLLFAGCSSNSSAENETEPTAEGGRSAVTLQGPVTVEFWHCAGGDIGELLQQQVNRFNETNGLGITVTATYKSSYSDIMDGVKANYGSGNVPDILMVGGGGTETLADAGVAADMSAYVTRDQFDMSNIPESLRYYSEHFEGKVIQFPFLVNASIVYYNKAYYPEGFPTTLEDWIAQAQNISQDHPGVYGMGLPLDTGYIQRPLIRSLGSPGLTTSNGTEPGCLRDNSLETVMTDWISWIDGGYCISVKNTDLPAEFMAGKLASFSISCVNTANYIERAKQAGISLGYAPCVAYGGYAGGLGGGGLCVLEKSTDQELAACWEFIKFLFEDQQIAEQVKTDCVVPTTYSSANSEYLQAFFVECPGPKVAFDALDNATYNEWSSNMVKWRNEIRSQLLEVINNRSLTPNQAVRQLERRADAIFSNS